MLSKREKSKQRHPENGASKSVMEEASSESHMNGEKSIGELKVPGEMSGDEPCSLSEEPEKIAEAKFRAELKPPRVLEVFSRDILLLCINWHVIIFIFMFSCSVHYALELLNYV